MKFNKLDILDIKNNSYSFEFKDGLNILGLNKKHYGLIESSFDKFFRKENIEAIDKVSINNSDNLDLNIDDKIYDDKFFVEYIPRNITTDLLEEELESYIIDFLNDTNTNIILKQDLIRLREHIYRIKELTPYRNCNFNDYKAGINNISSVKFSKKNIEELNLLKKDLEERLSSMEKVELSDEDSDRMEEIKSNHRVYENLEKEKNLILLNMDPTVDLEPHKIEFSRIKKKKQIREKLSYISLIIAVILVYFERGIKSLPFFIAGIFLFLAKMKIDKRVKRLGYTLYKNNKKEKDVENLLKDIDLEQKKLLNKYKLDTRLDFKKFVDKIDARLESIKDKNASYNALVGEIDEVKGRISREENSIRQNEDNLREILIRNRVDDLSKLAFNIDLKSKRDDLKEKYREEKREFILKIKDEDLFKFIEEFNSSSINNVIKGYTNNYYTRAILDEKLSIKVENKNGEILSKIEIGQVESLYSLFKFGIIKASEDIKLPLILNNCFHYFNDREKESIYNHINKISKLRQVILITYDEVDISILDKSKKDYSLVKIL